MDADIIVTNHGSIIALVGNTDAGAEWLAEHLPEDCPTLGASYCVETRFADDILDGAAADGLEIE